MTPVRGKDGSPCITCKEVSTFCLPIMANIHRSIRVVSINFSGHSVTPNFTATGSFSAFLGHVRLAIFCLLCRISVYFHFDGMGAYAVRGVFIISFSIVKPEGRVPVRRRVTKGQGKAFSAAKAIVSLGRIRLSEGVFL